MERTPCRLGIDPEQCMLTGSDLRQYITLRDHVFRRVALLVGEVATAQIHRTRRVVVQLYPSVAFAIVIHEVILVDDQYFI